MKNIESYATPPEERESVEPVYDPRLENLWEKYELVGNPPQKDSVAETRLKERCEEYASYSIGANSKFSGSKAAYNYDVNKRRIHNEIAIMVMGAQRSGMKSSLAQHIANFAIEYATGYENGKIESFEKREE
jgi:hypothetical protein